MPKIKRDNDCSMSPSIADEFANVSIKDQRLVDRLAKTARLFEQEPEKSIPNTCGSWAKTKAVYRLLDNDKIDCEVILAGHRQQTLERIKEHEVILCVQDTTSLDFSTHQKTEGLGPHSTSAGSLGLLIHTTLAVTTTGVPLGILSKSIWARPAATRGKRHRRKELPLAEKESRKWLEAMEKSQVGLPACVTAVTVGDREADVYDLFLKASSEGKHLLIRATQDRRVDGEQTRLSTQVEKAPLLGQCIVKVPRASEINQPPREARLALKVCPVTILPPFRRTSERLPDVKLYAIQARELSAPDGVKPIEWLLLTTLKVETLQEAVEKIDWYRHRWKIERYHFVLKSGCKVEDLQLETDERLKNAIAIYAVVAWRLTWITYQAREIPDAPCSVILPEAEWQTLFCLVNRTSKPPRRPPALKEAVIMIARLGGFLARKHDGDPGVKVLWRGMQKLNEVMDALKTLQSLAPPQDVGND